MVTPHPYTRRKMIGKGVTLSPLPCQTRSPSSAIKEPSNPLLSSRLISILHSLASSISFQPKPSRYLLPPPFLRFLGLVNSFFSFRISSLYSCIKFIRFLHLFTHEKKQMKFSDLLLKSQYSIFCFFFLIWLLRVFVFGNALFYETFYTKLCNN